MNMGQEKTLWTTGNDSSKQAGMAIKPIVILLVG